MLYTDHYLTFFKIVELLKPNKFESVFVLIFNF